MGVREPGSAHSFLVARLRPPIADVFADRTVQQRGVLRHHRGGKSIVMVLLAKWILENNPHARVAIITDRDELDKQIERVFAETGEDIRRTSSGRDPMKLLGQARPRLMCSLVHKFGRRDVDDFDAFIKDLEAQPSATFGEVFVFVDECHRTQSGELHRVMKAMMPNAVFIGFTGTPLLARDRHASGRGNTGCDHPAGRFLSWMQRLTCRSSGTNGGPRVLHRR